MIFTLNTLIQTRNIEVNKITTLGPCLFFVSLYLMVFMVVRGIRTIAVKQAGEYSMFSDNSTLIPGAMDKNVVARKR